MFKRKYKSIKDKKKEPVNGNVPTLQSFFNQRPNVNTTKSPMKSIHVTPPVIAQPQEEENIMRFGENIPELTNLHKKIDKKKFKSSVRSNAGARWIRNQNYQDQNLEKIDNLITNGNLQENNNGVNKNELLKNHYKSQCKHITLKKNISNQFEIPIDSTSKILMPYTPYDYQETGMKNLFKALTENKRNIFFESPTGTGKTQMLLSTIFSFLEQSKRLSQTHKIPQLNHRILYFTRTTSQMNQVISEAKKTGFNIRGSILASRKQLCLNEEVIKLGTLAKINKKCKQMFVRRECPYQTNFLKSEIIGFDQLMDIEDMASYGKKNSKCSFFMSRKLIKTSNLVVMSYNYMSDSILRANIKEYMKDSIIVIDEGHNVCEVFEKSSSFEWNFYSFKICLQEINQMKNSDKTKESTEINFNDEDEEDFIIGENSKNKYSFEKITTILNSLSDWISEIWNTCKNSQIAKNSNQIYCGSSIIDLFNLDNLKISQKDLYFLIRWIENLQSNKQSKVELFVRILLDLIDLFGIDRSIFMQFKLTIETRSKLHFMCMNPSISFKKYLGSRQSFNIIMSGTLRPFEMLEDQLGVTFDHKLIVTPNLDEWKQKLFICKQQKLFQFSSMNQIKFTYQTRQNQVLQKDCLNYISSVSKTTSEGALVFVSSYSVLDDFKRVIDSNFGIRSSIEKHKKIYFENKIDNNMSLFARYKVIIILLYLIILRMNVIVKTAMGLFSS
jgi:DNA repair helicase Rad3